MKIVDIMINERKSGLLSNKAEIERANGDDMFL